MLEDQEFKVTLIHVVSLESVRPNQRACGEKRKRGREGKGREGGKEGRTWGRKGESRKGCGRKEDSKSLDFPTWHLFEGFCAEGFPVLCHVDTRYFGDLTR